MLSIKRAVAVLLLSVVMFTVGWVCGRYEVHVRVDTVGDDVAITSEKSIELDEVR